MLLAAVAATGAPRRTKIVLTNAAAAVAASSSSVARSQSRCMHMNLNMRMVMPPKHNHNHKTKKTWMRMMHVMNNPSTTSTSSAATTAASATRMTWMRMAKRMIRTYVLSEPLVPSSPSPSSSSSSSSSIGSSSSSIPSSWRVPAATCAAVTAAKQLHQKYDALNNDKNDDALVLIVVGPHKPTHIPQGIQSLMHCRVSTMEHPPPHYYNTAEMLAAAVLQAISSFQSSSSSSSNEKKKNDDDEVIIVMGAATKFGATVLPRIAALHNVSPITDVIRIDAHDTFVRPMYAGNVLVKVQHQPQSSSSPPSAAAAIIMRTMQVVSIRPTSFDKAPLTELRINHNNHDHEKKDPDDPHHSNVRCETLDLDPQSAWTGSAVVVPGEGDDPEREENEKEDNGHPYALVDLTAARVVVSGGRGLQEARHFSVTNDSAGLLPTLAWTLDAKQASVGASRAAVDAGLVPNEYQVGQTGTVVAPELYVAVGISGAIQHLSGMKDSKTIVAINKDPDAPIFQVADYGLVADLFTAVPELTTKLQQQQQQQEEPQQKLPQE